MGFDVHRLVPERELWLGGIRLEHSMGLLGHSDADVLIHAICDALLGAANMRDIGYHFPDTGAEFKNIDSKILLRRTVERAAELGVEPAVMTFDTHPESLVTGKSPALLNTIEDRKRLMQHRGMDEILVLPFDEKLRSLGASIQHISEE